MISVAVFSVQLAGSHPACHKGRLHQLLGSTDVLMVSQTDYARATRGALN
jgi:hypothetical protein